MVLACSTLNCHGVRHSYTAVWQWENLYSPITLFPLWVCVCGGGGGGVGVVLQLWSWQWAPGSRMSCWWSKHCWGMCTYEACGLERGKGLGFLNKNWAVGPALEITTYARGAWSVKVAWVRIPVNPSRPSFEDCNRAGAWKPTKVSTIFTAVFTQTNTNFVRII